MVRKAIVEAVGTFFLMLIIGLVVLEPGAGALAPLAIGGGLAALIYAGGHISGAHYNPAVSVAVWLRGLARPDEVGVYWAAQFLGAALAVLVVRVLKGPVDVLPMEVPVTAALLAEFLFTFALAYVILNVATARGNDGNSHYGLAIGFTVMAGAYAVGPISGAAFNPAVVLGITLLGLVPAGAIWIYLVANLAGAVSAALLFNALDLGADKPTAATVAEQAGLQPPAAPGR